MSQPRNAVCDCGSGKKYKKCCGLSVLVPGANEETQYARPKLEHGEYLHILMPTRGTVCIETMIAVSQFGWNKEEYARLSLDRATFLAMPRMPVAEARERLCDAAMQGMIAQPEVTHWILWIDDDATPRVTDILILLQELRRNTDIGILSAYVSPKEANHPGLVPAFGGSECRYLTPGVDFQPNQIVEVPWVGLHCAMMRGETLLRLGCPRFPTNVTGTGEDVAFSYRIRDAGYVCAVHAGIIVPHIDAATGEAFIPNIGAPRVKPEKWLDHNPAALGA